MDNNELTLAVCNWETAHSLMVKEPDIDEALVVTNCVEEGEIILVPKQEFIEYLKGKKE